MNDFRTIMATAKKMVTANFPEAKLWEAQGSEESKKATKASDVTHWSFVFNAIVNYKQGTVIIEWDKGNWSNLTVVPYGWYEDLLVPDTFRYSLQEAIDIMVKEGYDKPFSRVAFRYPLAYPLSKEAFFIFNMYELGEFVFVGVDTGKVTTEKFPVNMMQFEEIVAS